jgi:hypothetical protein
MENQAPKKRMIGDVVIKQLKISQLQRGGEVGSKDRVLNPLPPSAKRRNGR